MVNVIVEWRANDRGRSERCEGAAREDGFDLGRGACAIRARRTAGSANSGTRALNSSTAASNSSISGSTWRKNSTI
jgi:hypothetical protein